MSTVITVLTPKKTVALSEVSMHQTALGGVSVGYNNDSPTCSNHDCTSSHEQEQSNSQMADNPDEGSKSSDDLEKYTTGYQTWSQAAQIIV